MLRLSGFVGGGAGDGTPGLHMLGSAQLRLRTDSLGYCWFRRQLLLILSLHVCLPQPADHTASFFCGFCFSQDKVKAINSDHLRYTWEASCHIQFPPQGHQDSLWKRPHPHCM